MCKVISVNCPKGGSGKSNCVVYLSYVLATVFKKKVCIIDLCPNSDIANMLGKDRKKIKYTTLDWFQSVQKDMDKQTILSFGKTGIDFIPSGENIDQLVNWIEQKWSVGRERKLAHRIQPLKQFYDYILFDNHPNSTDQKNIYSMVASDHVIITFEPSPAGKEAVCRGYEHVTELKAEGYNSFGVSILPTKIDHTKIDLQLIQSYAQQLQSDYDIPLALFLPPIRSCSIIKNNTLAQIIQNDKISNEYVQNVINDYLKVTKELMQRW